MFILLINIITVITILQMKIVIFTVEHVGSREDSAVGTSLERWERFRFLFLQHHQHHHHCIIIIAIIIIALSHYRMRIKVCALYEGFFLGRSILCPQPPARPMEPMELPNLMKSCHSLIQRGKGGVWREDHPSISSPSSSSSGILQYLPQMLDF